MSKHTDHPEPEPVVYAAVTLQPGTTGDGVHATPHATARGAKAPCTPLTRYAEAVVFRRGTPPRYARRPDQPERTTA